MMQILLQILNNFMNVIRDKGYDPKILAKTRI